MTPPLIYLIAGEPSGDLIGARLMAAIKRRTGGAVRFTGVGGEKMQKEGLESLFPISDIALFGATEIIPHLPLLLRRFRETTADVLAKKPDILVSIDVPGFSFEIAKRLRKAGGAPPLVHYVAPTVWAYRPGRALHIAKLYDHLMVLLPFEPPYFTEVGLPCSFTGHPIVEEWETLGDRAAFRKRHGIAETAQVLCLLPGSRRGELARHLPIFGETVARLAKRFPDLTLVLPISGQWRGLAEEASRSWPLRTVLVDSMTEKKDAFAGSDAALAKSGTVTLEAAIARLPMAMMYRVNPLTAWLAKRMLKVRHFTLVNLLADAEIIPEYVQENATPEKLAAAIGELLTSPEARARQVEEAQKAIAKLQTSEKPSEQAARTVLSLLKQ